MPKPLSDDLRKRIIAAKKRGDIEDKIAADKEVSKSTVTKRGDTEDKIVRYIGMAWEKRIWDTLNQIAII
jgi:hypothetical protein